MRLLRGLLDLAQVAKWRMGYMGGPKFKSCFVLIKALQWQRVVKL